MDGIFIIKYLKKSEYNLETIIQFMYYDKIFDCLLRNKLWRIMEIKGFKTQSIIAIKSLCKSTYIMIDCKASSREDFEIK